MKRIRPALLSTAIVCLSIAWDSPAQACKIYWTASGGIYRANLDGSGVELFSSAGANDIAVDPVHGLLYATTWTPENGIAQWWLDGSGPQIIVHEPSGTNPHVDPQRLDVFPGTQAQTILWTVRVLYTTTHFGQVKRINPSNGPEAFLVTQSNVGEVAIDGPRGRFYVADSSVRRANLDGSDVVTVVPAYTQIEGLAVDSQAGQIYWSGLGAIRRADLDGGNAADLLTGLSSSPRLAVDPEGGALYWADRIAHTVNRVALDGSRVETLFSTASGPFALALDLRDVDLRVSRGTLSWAPVPGAAHYGVVAGDLGTLRSTQGDFAQATTECLADEPLAETSLALTETPAAGQGFWFLVRPTFVGVGTPDTWDACTLDQVGSRDAGIEASPAGCP